MAVFDIRGTHGSGKSHIVHTLLKRYQSEPIMRNNKQIGHFIPELDCAIVGKYLSACGGCDGIGNQDEVVRRLKRFSKKYKYVILEGILVSHTFARFEKVAKRMDDYRFLFLDTPLRICISRVKKRRLARGNKKEFNPKNVIKDHYNIWTSVKNKCINAGCSVVILNWKEAFPQFMRLLTQ